VEGKRRSQTLQILAAATLALTVLGIALYRGRKAALPADPKEQTQSTVVDPSDEEAAYQAVKKALETPPGEALLPLVRDAERISPHLKWYFAQKEARKEPWKVTGRSLPTSHTYLDNEYLAMRVETPERPLDVLVQKFSDGWKLDWETFSDVHSGRWHFFLRRERELPETAEFPLHVEALPAGLLVSNFFDKSGASRESKTIRLKLYSFGGDYGAAILTDTDPLAATFATIKTGDRPRRYVLEVKLLSSESFPPYVQILRIVQLGWPQLTKPNSSIDSQPKAP
jgi:hypothetical protein